MTNPPPKLSAPTLMAVHKRGRDVNVVAAMMGRNEKSLPTSRRRFQCEIISSISPHAKRTSTSAPPNVRVASAPSVNQSTQRIRTARLSTTRFQEGTRRSVPALSAMIGTTAPAPSVAPLSQGGMWFERMSAPAAMMRMRPGLMKQKPARRAPKVRRSLHPQ